MSIIFITLTTHPILHESYRYCSTEKRRKEETSLKARLAEKREKKMKQMAEASDDLTKSQKQMDIDSIDREGDGDPHCLFPFADCYFITSLAG